MCFYFLVKIPDALMDVSMLRISASNLMNNDLVCSLAWEFFFSIFSADGNHFWWFCWLSLFFFGQQLFAQFVFRSKHFMCVFPCQNALKVCMRDENSSGNHNNKNFMNGMTWFSPTVKINQPEHSHRNLIGCGSKSSFTDNLSRCEDRKYLKYIVHNAFNQDSVNTFE